MVPLEPLLDSRIGIRGWFSIKPFLTRSPNILENILSSNSNAGGVEIAIRFTKTDDFLRILSTARDIGWTRNSEMEMSNKSTNNDFKLNLSKNEEAYQVKASECIKCLIEIERAVHLSTVFDEKLNKHNPPNPFVSFGISLENPSEIAQTSVCEKQSSPLWNYQLQVNVAAEYFIEDGKKFVFKVWHKSSSNKLLGYASIDMQPLMCGLSCISGWYNIQDSVGCTQGQLKVNVFPQESLLYLKKLHESKKKTHYNLNSTISRFNFSTPSITSLGTEYKCSSAENSCHLHSSNTSISNLSSGSQMDQIFRQKESKSELRLGLMKKLNELDELNKYLKEQLDKKSLKKGLTIFNIYRINK